jgi:dihydrofolate reductase
MRGMQIVLIAAQSADGFITRHDDPGTDFTSAADRVYFQKVLTAFDTSVMGSVTYRVARSAILRRLTPDRRRMVMTRDPAQFAAEAAPGRLEFTDETPEALAGRLRTEGHRRCALLGGGRIHSLFIAAGLVDEFWLTIEPRLFGSGVPLLRAPADLRLRLLSHERLDGSDTLLLKYARQ